MEEFISYIKTSETLITCGRLTEGFDKIDSQPCHTDCCVVRPLTGERVA
jgi:hypothetical protein